MSVVESIKPQYSHMVLEQKIKELTPMSRSEFTSIALGVAAQTKDEQWEKIFEEVSVLPKSGEDLSVPNAMQLRLDPSNKRIFYGLWQKIHEILSESHKLSRLKKQVYILLIWQNYYDYLKEESLNVGKTGETSITSEMSAPEMFKTLAEIVLLNRKNEDSETIAEIKAILQQWKDKNT